MKILTHPALAAFSLFVAITTAKPAPDPRITADEPKDTPPAVIDGEPETASRSPCCSTHQTVWTV
jgi:hypothetical protein